MKKFNHMTIVTSYSGDWRWRQYEVKNLGRGRWLVNDETGDEPARPVVMRTSQLERWFRPYRGISVSRR